MAMLDSQAFWELMVDSAPLSVTAADSTTYYSQDLPMHASAWNTETYIPPAVADVGMSAAPSSAVAYMNTQQAALWSSNTWSAPQQAVDYTRDYRNVAQAEVHTGHQTHVARQNLATRAPCWADSTWHPMAQVKSSGQRSIGGTGVFLPRTPPKNADAHSSNKTARAQQQASVAAAHAAQVAAYNNLMAMGAAGFQTIPGCNSGW
eukprot:jgi/Chrzof1/4009/Cz13g17030.t1